MNIRHGYYAGWRGREYEASPDGPEMRLYSAQPAEGFARVTAGRYVRPVPREELDHFVYVSTVCTWRGEPFLVLGEHQEWLRVEYIGGRATVAEQLGLENFDRGVYQAWAPRAEVSRLREDLV